MKIRTYGSRFHGGQVDRIDVGFIDLGHEMSFHNHDADLIFSNDPGSFDQILIDRCAGGIRAKVVFNVQDIPLHLGSSFDSGKLKSQLIKADAVTTISEYVQWQVKEYLGLDSQIIYQPIKPVHRDPSAQLLERKRFAHIGRKSDLNKRHALGVYALQILGYQPSDVFLVGNETGWGDYCGVLSDWNLNRVYNSVDFVLCTSKIEGLLLPALESMSAGVIPVVCNDMTTRRELLPPDIFPEYNAVEPTPESVARFIARYVNNSEEMAVMKERLYAHYQKNWAHKLTGRAVAEQILEAAKNTS
jgi:hypothetical protein